MKRLLFLPVVFISLNMFGQIKPDVLKKPVKRPIINPKDNKPKPIDQRKVYPIDNRVIKNMDNHPILNLAVLNGSYYILDHSGRSLWAANSQTDKVVMFNCFVDDGQLRWNVTTNPDGTCTISTQSNTNKKLVYQRSTFRVPGRTGLSGSPNTQNGLYVQANPANSNYVEVNYKWRLNKISGDLYWLVADNRKDSFQVKLWATAGIPINQIDYNFTNLTGWEQSTASTPSAVNAFSGQPSQVNTIPYFSSPVVPNMPLGGSYWKGIEDKLYSYSSYTSGGYINTSRPWSERYRAPDETRTGVLTSLPFMICSDRISFRIGGTQDAARIKFEFFQRVPQGTPGAELFSDGYYKLVQSFTGHNNDISRIVVLNTSEQFFKPCRFRITDNSTTGHIIIDDIDLTSRGHILSDPVPPSPDIPSTKPIWGVIDMHTHPMSYMGMGGKLMYGKLDGNPAVELNNCNAMHGGWGTDNPNGNYLRAEAVNMLDAGYPLQFKYKIEDGKIPHTDHPHEGFPEFRYWPAQNTMTHQQMWYEWLRRARDGGLKAIIALTVNSEVLGRVLGGDPPYDDKTTADREIDGLIAFVHRHNDFLDTVTTPARMRQVVNEGKMAVIIGMEIDNIGNFYENVPVTEDQIRNEITRLKNKGVRYIFPIHVVDNKFGGSALYNELFNFSNKYATGQPVTGSVPVDMYPSILPGHLYHAESAPDPRVTFRLETGEITSVVAKIRAIRPLLDLIDLGGLPPDPLLLPLKPLVDPVLLALKNSQQYQLAKKIFLDLHPQLDTYSQIRRSDGTPGGERNQQGLSVLGRFAITEMMRQGMMIDADHASEKAVNEMLQIGLDNDYPINSGHNGLRGNHDNEKTRTIEQMQSINRTGGMFGIGWEDQTPVQFAANLRRHSTLVNGRISFGSDIDGYAMTIRKPETTDRSKMVHYTENVQHDALTMCGMAGTSRKWDFNREGMAHIGLYPDFFESLSKNGMSMVEMNNLFLGCEHFVEMWEKCERRAR